jgi:K+-transporting ATPase ATPase A chain
MTTLGVLQIVGYVAVIVLAVRPLGSYMARVFQSEHSLLDSLLSPVERLIYRFAGIRPDEEMDWKANAVAMLLSPYVQTVAVKAMSFDGFAGAPPAPPAVESPSRAMNS